MLMVESDGKALLRSCGIAVPEGTVVAAGETPTLSGADPWIVKAQVPVGGRGKAGGVIRCDNAAAVNATLKRMFDISIKGHLVHRCLVEHPATGTETYLSLMLDPANYGVRVTLIREGGVNVEESGLSEHNSRLCEPEHTAIVAALRELTAEPALLDVGDKLARLFLDRELILAEINPLFVGANSCVAGDAKLVVDLNAAERQPEIARLIEAAPEIYPDAVRKLRDGFDYVEVDPKGEIGLLTTGAGLSMMLIDEMTARGGKPLNFCDIRTGLLRGDPTRLIKVLGWIGERDVKVLLVNIFAGITDLAEFAELLCVALERTPSLKAPIVARIVGSRVDKARAIFAAKRPDIAVEEQLTAALGRVDAILRGAAS
jgi:succinyl-CoA synthetase beta subunit